VEKKEIAKHLQEKMPSLEIKQDEDMTKHTSFKVGGKADIWIKIKTLEELTYLLQYTKQNNIPLTILGNGSNVIVKEKGIRGITIVLDFKEIEVEEKEEKVVITVGAGVKLGMLAVMLQKKEIAGFEFASRNSRNNRRSNPHECRSLWKRNERNCRRSHFYR